MGVLLLRRVPAVLLARSGLRPLHGPRDALLVGWFGPIGVSALLYAMLARGKGAPDTVWAVASLTIVGSLLVHGVSSTPLSRRYAREAPGAR